VYYCIISVDCLAIVGQPLFLPKILTELSYNIILRVLGLAIYTGYFTYFLGNGQTIGMKAVKIKLCGTDGTYPIGYKKGFLRWVGMTISNLVIGLGYLWILIDENKQGWHDKMAGTYVVYFTPTQIEFFQSSETAV